MAKNSKMGWCQKKKIKHDTTKGLAGGFKHDTSFCRGRMLITS
jgi:hypothetical protein